MPIRDGRYARIFIGEAPVEGGFTIDTEQWQPPGLIDFVEAYNKLYGDDEAVATFSYTFAPGAQMLHLKSKRWQEDRIDAPTTDGTRIIFRDRYSTRPPRREARRGIVER